MASLEKPKTIFGESILSNDKNISARLFLDRVKRDTGGTIFRATGGFDEKKREELSNKMIEGLKKRQGVALGYGNVHPEDIKTAKGELDKGTFGVYKNLSFKEKQDLKKTLDVLSKTVPNTTQKDSFPPNKP